MPELIDTTHTHRIELAGQVMATQGICRFCGCDRHNRCTLGDGNPCGRIDQRHTICTNPICRLHYQALMKPALEAMISNRCAGSCGGSYKSVRQVLCRRCWEQLPWVMGGGLYAPMDRGLACYYAEALEFLKLAQKEEEMQ